MYHTPLMNGNCVPVFDAAVTSDNAHTAPQLILIFLTVCWTLSNLITPSFGPVPSYDPNNIPAVPPRSTPKKTVPAPAAID